MRAFLIFTCIVTICHEGYAKIPADEIKVNIFDSRPRDFEIGVFKATKTTRDFFARDEVLLALGVGLIAAKEFMSPFVAQFIQIAPLIQKTVEDRSEWSAEFARTIANETMRSIADSEVRWMAAEIRTIQTKIKLLNESNPDFDNRKTVASIIHTGIDKMINFFDLKSSLFRKFPLIGGPPLLQLASLVAVFSPVAIALIPAEAKNSEITCKMYDTLMDYRPLTVYARLQKLSGKKIQFTTLFDVMKLPYNRNGYISTVPAVLDCERNCANRPFSEHNLCLKDTFGTEEFFMSNYTHDKCVADYAALLRHRVEELFPIDVMAKLCGPRKPTGYGSLTVHFQKVYTYGKANGKQCRLEVFDGCNPYIELSINDEVVLVTQKQKGVYSYDADKTFTSGKIPKTSTIKIEVRNSKDKAISNQDKLILSYEGKVESFLKQGLITGTKILGGYGGLNRIETIAFWEDEYE